jgi:hypothetical protein
VPSAKVHGAAQAAANPVTITNGKIHGLANVALVLLFKPLLLIRYPFMWSFGMYDHSFENIHQIGLEA